MQCKARAARVKAALTMWLVVLSAVGVFGVRVVAGFGCRGSSVGGAGAVWQVVLQAVKGQRCRERRVRSGHLHRGGIHGGI